MVRFANGGIGKVGCVLEGNVKYQFNVRLHGAKGTLVNDTFRTTYMDPGLEGYARFPTILPDTPGDPPPLPRRDRRPDRRHPARPARQRLNPAEDAKTYEIVFGAEQSAREGRPVKPAPPRRGCGRVTGTSFEAQARSLSETKASRSGAGCPITTWSSTSMSSRSPAATASAVIRTSSGEGEGSPLGWLWTTISEARSPGWPPGTAPPPAPRTS